MPIDAVITRIKASSNDTCVFDDVNRQAYAWGSYGSFSLKDPEGLKTPLLSPEKVNLTVYKLDNGVMCACPPHLIEYKKKEYRESFVRQDFDFDNENKELFILDNINYF